MAISRVDHKTQYYILSSKAYMKKQNLTSDRAQWSAWEVYIRTETHELFVTVLRRKFIPPLMEIFQDLILISAFDLLDEHGQTGEYRRSEQFLSQVHRTGVDTVYPVQRYSNIYKNIIEEKATALLMDEDTVNFYHYNLNIMPNGITYAVNYLRSILGIMARYNGEYCKELLRQLKSMKLVRKEDLVDKSPADIVRSFEQSSSFSVKNNINWTSKIARYLAHCIDGGILCSQFTLSTLIRMIANVTETLDELNLKTEILYLLHVRKKTQKYERTGENITSVIKTLISAPDEFTFNENILGVLIESGYIQAEFNFLNPGEYPNFLKHVLLHTERIKLKEASCRQIIKIFAEKKKENKTTTGHGGTTAGGPNKVTPGGEGGGGGKKADESSKIEFINLVEPLIKTMKTANFNLASLSASALVNLCNYSEDIKDIFI